MLEFFRRLVAGVQESWRRLSVGGRVQIATVGVLVFALLMIVVYAGTRPQYVRLYSRLDPEEANEIVIWLNDNNIEYELSNNGTAIDVPVQSVQRARLGLVEMGLPRTQGLAEGFELFTERDLLTNQWLQNVDFMRALQGELQRQLNQFDFVDRSFVFIREAADQLFVSEQQPSTATVILDARRALTPREVKAVLHTVSSFGGANLNTKNITLSLTDGTLLHSPMEDEFAALASNKIEAQAELERQRETKVEQAFRRMGRNATVRVSAIMDWNAEERDVRQVSEGAVISSMVSSTTTTSMEAVPQGAPGALANIPEGAAGQVPEGTSSETEEIIENFEPSEAITKTVLAPGRVEQFKVAAFIEGNYEPVLNEAGEPTGEQNYIPLTDEQISQYQQFILNAIGTGEEPTEIAIYDQPFRLDDLAAVQASEIPVSVPLIQNRVVQLTLQILAILAAFVVLRIFMRRALVLPTVEEEEVVELPEASKAELRRQEIAAEVERLSNEQPEVVAALLRSWMAEEES